jgi:hypothetical protein
MIPIKEAISTGVWLHFSRKEEQIQFRLKVLSFQKFKFFEIDEPENMKERAENVQWRVLKVEVINLSKKNIYSTDGPGEILLIDNEGYEFEVTYDEHLWRNSKIGERLGLNRFYFERLIPKTKVVGAIAFLLPDDDEVEYSLSIEEGEIKEA